MNIRLTFLIKGFGLERLGVLRSNFLHTVTSENNNQVGHWFDTFRCRTHIAAMLAPPASALKNQGLETTVYDQAPNKNTPANARTFVS